MVGWQRHAVAGRSIAGQIERAVLWPLALPTMESVSLLVVVTKDLIARLKASELIKEMAAEVGGTGGGRPEMAQAGGKDPAKLDVALEKVFGLVERMLQRYTNGG